ncbi:transposase [Streptomyces sp. NBC_01022]|nr:transposase [Streptomyces sp. NBC_01022]
MAGPPARRRDRATRADREHPAHPAPGRRARLPAGDQGAANLQEARHALARKIFHGRAGQLYQDGMEGRIGALGLVLNALVPFNTRYVDAALTQLRADGFEVREEDGARLSPFVRHHINVLGRCSFQLPDLPGGMRPLRDPESAQD